MTQIFETAAITFGWLLIAVGLIGFLLPILQGFLFFGLGVLVLNRYSPLFSRELERTRKRHPKLARRLDQAEERIKSLFTLRRRNSK